MIAFCGACRHAIHPPQLVCPECWNEAIEFKPVSGTGTVYSHTVNHQPWAPDMAVPFALAVVDVDGAPGVRRSEEHTSELQSLMRISYAVFCLKTKNKEKQQSSNEH